MQFKESPWGWIYDMYIRVHSFKKEDANSLKFAISRGNDKSVSVLILSIYIHQFFNSLDVIESRHSYRRLTLVTIRRTVKLGYSLCSPQVLSLMWDSLEDYEILRCSLFDSS